MSADSQSEHGSADASQLSQQSPSKLPPPLSAPARLASWLPRGQLGSSLPSQLPSQPLPSQLPSSCPASRWVASYPTRWVQINVPSRLRYCVDETDYI